MIDTAISIPGSIHLILLSIFIPLRVVLKDLFLRLLLPCPADLFVGLVGKNIVETSKARLATGGGDSNMDLGFR
jgi:hypothetical protein